MTPKIKFERRLSHYRREISVQGTNRDGQTLFAFAKFTGPSVARDALDKYYTAMETDIAKMFGGSP